MSSWEVTDIDVEMPKVQRPICPKCGMNMIAFSAARLDKRKFECLRCGHSEEQKVEG
jgi:predicted RNA-binding Zn-ribbon protein involved in translation (DUF1610 family)